MRKTLLVDFDGVLHDYKGWQGAEVLNNPLPGARGAMWLLERHFKLVCFTTRPAEYVTPWLKLHGFPEMKVTNIKEPAFLILDDRAVTFRGKWNDSLIQEIRNFRPYWEEEKPRPLVSLHGDPD